MERLFLGTEEIFVVGPITFFLFSRKNGKARDFDRTAF